ncbi:hypothetical protein AVEN_269019-1 [Araneus ventricosus]|uniref:Uncharacterized protein n=1 Tax=Araneus ventricosus TaxID=182803 RepID=A0A4Y2SZA2_ARAVE|nr:hypothetical protein AVEN_269019-1 [Araneus ventricosus]
MPDSGWVYGLPGSSPLWNAITPFALCGFIVNVQSWRWLLGKFLAVARGLARWRHRKALHWTEEVNFQIAFLEIDGAVLYEINATKYDFKKSCNWGFHAFLTRESVSTTERKAFLPEDSLTVQCTMWNKGEKPVKPKDLYSRTIFKVNRRSFTWRIGKFSTR